MHKAPWIPGDGSERSDSVLDNGWETAEELVGTVLTPGLPFIEGFSSCLSPSPLVLLSFTWLPILSSEDISQIFSNPEGFPGFIE